MKKSAALKIPWSTWLVAFASFFSWGAFAARPSGEWQLAAIVSSIGALILLVGLVIQEIIKWRERGVANVISCVLIVAASLVGPVAGRTVRSLQLSHDIDRYNAAAQWVLTHNNPDSIKLVSLPSHYADLGHVVIYESDELCGTRIDFLWGVAFPVKHVVRRYATSTKWLSVKECRKYWGRITPISMNWYELSDM